MFKKGLLSMFVLGSIFFTAVVSSKEVQATTLEEVGISKEQAKEYDRIASEKVKDYTNPLSKQRGVQETIIYGDGLYQIRFKDAPYYISTANGRSYNGNTFKSQEHSYNASSVFYIKNIGDGEVMIFDVLNFRAMEIKNSATKNGSRLQLRDANVNLPTMRWRFITAPTVHTLEVDSVQIVNVNSNLAITAKNGRVTTKNDFYGWSKQNTSSQKFLFEWLK